MIDDQGVLRVGGRLDHAAIPFNQQHPIILPSKHHLTDLIVRYEHERHLHAGPSATLAAMRCNYWPMAGKSTVRKITRQCMRCRRSTASTIPPLMGSLPEPRVKPGYPFSKCGVDFCGPFHILPQRKRGARPEKYYVAVFVCFSTKAVHLELVGALTTEACFNAIKRFFARRGLTTTFYSDNGTNFVGVYNEIKRLKELATSKELIQTLAELQVEWKFIPARTPHFGGLWEAAVKSAKRHLYRVSTNAKLTQEEFSTLLTQVEGCLNSRPITPLSEDSTDLIALTPGHFLIGRPITALPEHDLRNIQENRLSHWQRIQQISQHFWKRWSQEYLGELQRRSKWVHKQEALKRGMLVAIREDNLPPLRWKLGRVEDIHPGDDNIVRVVTIRTTTGITKISAIRLCPLPPVEDEKGSTPSPSITPRCIHNQPLYDCGLIHLRNVENVKTCSDINLQKRRHVSAAAPPTVLNNTPTRRLHRNSVQEMYTDDHGNVYTISNSTDNHKIISQNSLSVTHENEVVHDRSDQSERSRSSEIHNKEQRKRHMSAVVSPSHLLNNQRRKPRPNSSNDLRALDNPHSIKSNQVSNKNGNMVLQLMIPSSMQSSLENNNNYLSSSTHDISSNTKRRRPYSIEEPDVYSTLNAAYTNTVYSNDSIEYGRAYSIDDSSPRHTGSESYQEQGVPTTQFEKNQMFKTYLTKILSCIYALFIVTLGALVYISDVVIGNTLLAETFSLFLVVVAFIFLLYLMLDVRLYMNKRSRYNDLLVNKNESGEIECTELPNGTMQVSVALPEAATLQKELPHHYCLSKGRHSGSFYLKIGAAGFCLGHLIHSGLLLGYQIVFLTSEGDTFFQCASIPTLILDIIYPIYSFLLLYFLFKYSNVIINKNIPLARFGLMHCIASSLCFWLWTILRETVDSLASHKEDHDSEEMGSRSAESYDAPSSMPEISFLVGDNPMALAITSYSKKGAEELVKYLNQSTKSLASSCYGNEGLSLIYRNYSPYLYPFSVEFSILVVGVLFIIWQSIGNCYELDLSHGETSRECESNILPTDNQESNLVLHADCHSANKGLFCGIVAVVACFVSIILFFIAISEDKNVELGVLVNSLTELILVSAMAIAGILAYRQITKLDINTHPVSLLDDLLLFICLPMFFIDAIFGIVPAILNGNPLTIVEIVVRIIQILVQTPLIIDGLRRCSNTKELRRQKPGRELITFLIVCNVAMWITQTFEVKSHGLKDNRYEFYGEILWTVIGHLTIPLTMFYRFHASVCLGDIWKNAYEPSGH